MMVIGDEGSHCVCIIVVVIMLQHCLNCSKPVYTGAGMASKELRRRGIFVNIYELVGQLCDGTYPVNTFRGTRTFPIGSFRYHNEDDDDPENVFTIAKNLIKNALKAKGIDFTEMKIREEESMQVVLRIKAFIPANYGPSGKKSPTFIDLCSDYGAEEGSLSEYLVVSRTI